MCKNGDGYCKKCGKVVILKYKNCDNDKIAEIKIAIKHKNAFIKNAIILEIGKIKNAKKEKAYVQAEDIRQNVTVEK